MNVLSTIKEFSPASLPSYKDKNCDSKKLKAKSVAVTVKFSITGRRRQPLS